MQNGSWYHPGREPTTIIERARKEAREALRENVAKDLRRQVRAAMQKAKL
jgi:trimethylamine:corrinoid methyltransferase-like protein